MRAWERELLAHKRQVDQASLGTGYPGPAEARMVMKEIQKCHWHTTTHRLLVGYCSCQNIVFTVYSVL